MVQAKAFKDYIPLGLYEEWPPPNLRQLKKIGGDILVLLLVLKGRTEMSVEDLEKFNVNHKLLAENNVIRIYDRVAYLNCDNKIFRYLLVQEESLDGKTAKKRVLKVKSEPEKVKKPRKTPRPRPLHNDEVQEILGLMNELRAKANLPYPLHYNADNFDQIKYMLGKYSKHDLLLGIKNYFGWILEEKEERMYGGDKVKSILNNFESKLSIAKRMNPQWRDGREAQLAKKDDPLSKLYNIFVLNWDDINSKNVKIIIDGNIERRKIASLAYRIFRKKLGDETPATHKSPEKLWRGCWSEAKKRGGLGSTADDDLNINGSLHSVRIVTFKGE